MYVGGVAYTSLAASAAYNRTASVMSSAVVTEKCGMSRNDSVMRRAMDRRIRDRHTHEEHA